MANKLIKDLTAATSVADTDLVLVGDPTTGQLKKALKSQIGISTANTAQSLTDGATILWNVANGNIAKVTLGGNRTLTISNMPTNSFAQLFVTQDATGSRTLTLTGGILPAAGLTLSTGAGARDILNVFYDGTDYFWSIEKYPAAYVPPSLNDLVFNFVNGVVQSGTRWTPNTSGGNAYSTTKLAAAADGYYQSKRVGTELTNAYQIIGLDPDAALESFSAMKYGVYFFGSTIEVIANGSIVTAITGTGRNGQANDLLRLRRVGGTGVVTAEWSSDNGSTWTVAHTFATTDTGILYPKIWFNNTSGFIESPKAYNFS